VHSTGNSLKDGNFFSLVWWNFIIIFIILLIIILLSSFLNLNESLGSWPWVSWCCLRGCGLGITGCLVWSSGLGIGFIVRDVFWFFSSARSSWWAIHRSISAVAYLFIAVLTISTVISVAWWEGLLWLDNYWYPFWWFLYVVIWLTLHDNVFFEIFITIHTSSEVLGIWWGAHNSTNLCVHAGRCLKESSGRWHSLGPCCLVEIWRGIFKRYSRSSS